MTSYWETKLRSDASQLQSLSYFKSEFMSLHSPHPLWTSCGSNSYEICKAIIQARMLSGRYRTDQLIRHFSSENNGSCSLCKNGDITGSIEHLLVHCPVLTDVRMSITENLETNKNMSVTTKTLINFYLQDTEFNKIQLLLDPSVLPQVILKNQTEGPHIYKEIFTFSRSWCYSIHKRRMKLLGRWKL